MRHPNFKNKFDGTTYVKKRPNDKNIAVFAILYFPFQDLAARIEKFDGTPVEKHCSKVSHHQVYEQTTSALQTLSMFRSNVGKSSFNHHLHYLFLASNFLKHFEKNHFEL